MPVMEEDIDEMFNFADQDRDGKISWRCATNFIFLSLLSRLQSTFYTPYDCNMKSNNVVHFIRVIGNNIKTRFCV